MSIVALKKPPSDLSDVLRKIADQADAGEVTDLIVAYHLNGNREFIYGTSLNDSLILATLLQQNCIDRMRK